MAETAVKNKGFAKAKRMRSRFLRSDTKVQVELKVLPKLRLLNCSGTGDYSDLSDFRLQTRWHHLLNVGTV